MSNEPDTIEHKGQIIGKVGGCQLIVKIDADGKKHFEATCSSKEARDELVALFEEEAVLRVQPLVKPEPKPEPEPEPVPD
ncbi:hypothetical protein ES703_120937 [subsurface metagenome]